MGDFVQLEIARIRELSLFLSHETPLESCFDNIELKKDAPLLESLYISSVKFWNNEQVQPWPELCRTHAYAVLHDSD